MYIWIEWICPRCQALHRSRFEIKPTRHLPMRLLEKAYHKGNIYIIDIPHRKAGRAKKGRDHGGGNKVYCDLMTPLSDILPVVRDYIQSHYSIEEGTLTLELCSP